jgi:hypothetical protein
MTKAKHLVSDEDREPLQRSYMACFRLVSRSPSFYASPDGPKGIAADRRNRDVWQVTGEYGEGRSTA